MISWVRTHPPEGSHVTSSGQARTRSGGPVMYLTFGFAAHRRHVFQRCLGVAVKRRASGGGSAVGAVSEATWVLTRPHWDFVPRRARVVTVMLNLVGTR